jgi:DHA1 family tetracycline resistance protein-like MFS transporter
MAASPVSESPRVVDDLPRSPSRSADDAQADRAMRAVMIYMALKVTADCATTSVWPLLLRDTLHGNIVLATTTAATMSSACGLAEVLMNPVVGKLSDRFGRKAFFFLGPLANCITSLLQIRYRRSIGICYLQRICSQTLSTVSGSTIGTATLADIVSGDRLTGALGQVGSWAGLGVIIGPLISGGLTILVGVENQIVVGYCVRAAVSGATVIFLALRLDETLPVEKRRPFALSGVNPFGFLKLFRGSGTLRRLVMAHGFSCMCEGKMTSDTCMAWLMGPVALQPSGVTAYLTGWGVACYASGAHLVHFFLDTIGPRRFTDLAMTTNALAHLLLGLVARPWVVAGYVALLTPGINNLAAAALKSQATKHAVAQGFGKGEFAAALASLRALAFVVAPTLWGRVYAGCANAGWSPGLAISAAGCLGAVLPGLLHRSISAQAWEPSEDDVVKQLF